MATGDDFECCEQAAEDMIRPEHRRRFKRIAASMDNLLREVRRYIPDANLYLEDSGNWHLMIGDSHDVIHGKATQRQDRIAVTAQVFNSSGGAW